MRLTQTSVRAVRHLFPTEDKVELLNVNNKEWGMTAANYFVANATLPVLVVIDNQEIANYVFQSIENDDEEQ